MDLDLTAEDRQFADRLGRWLADNVPVGWRDEGRDYEEYMKVQAEWESRLAVDGWTGIWWPREFGGLGATPTQRAIYAELTARYDAPEGIGRCGRRLLGPAVMRYGSQAQRSTILPAILKGKQVWCQGYSEPDAGSDLAAVRTKAVRHGDHYVINGSKIWTSEAQFADRCFVLVRTDAKAEKHAGLSILLVDLRSPGIEIRPISLLTGRPEFCEVYYRDVVVGADNLLGMEGQGWEISLYVLAHERGAVMVFDTLVRIERYFDQLVSISPDDVTSKIAVGESASEIAASRLLAYRMLGEQIRGGDPGDAGSISKLYWSRTWMRLAEKALTTVGEAIFTDDSVTSPENELLNNFLECRRGAIGSGTSEIQRNIVAKRMLGLTVGSNRAIAQKGRPPWTLT
jgi:alkylation response protein AidB-like acyl-CoA dehydrogenase